MHRSGVAIIASACLALSCAPAIAQQYAYVATGVGTVQAIDPATNAIAATIVASLFDLAVSPDGTLIYGTTYFGVEVIDPATKRVIDSISVDFGMDRIALTPDGRFAYATDPVTRTIYAIDTTQRRVAAAISLTQDPLAIAIAPDGQRAYVPCMLGGGAQSPGEVAIIDTQTNTVVSSITVPPPARFQSMALSPDGAFLYLSEITGSLIVIDTRTQAVTATIVDDPDPDAIAPAADNHLVYVAHPQSKSLSVVDVAARSVVARIPLSYEPGRMALSADGTRLYVVNSSACSVSIVEPSSRMVVATVAVDDRPWAIALGAAPPAAPTPTATAIRSPTPSPAPGAARACAYVTHAMFDRVSVIDTAAQSVVGSLSVAQQPLRIAVHPDGNRAYVSSLTNNATTGALAVIDTATNSVRNRIILGSNPDALALSPDGASAYVGLIDSCYALLAVDTATGAIDQRIRIAEPPPDGTIPLATGAVAVTPDGRRAYIVRGPDSVVTAIDLSTGATLAVIPLTKPPSSLALTPDGRFTYAVVPDEFVERPSTVEVIATATNTVTASLQVANYATGIAMRPDGRFAYVAHSDYSLPSTRNFVSVIDTTTNEVTTTIPVGQAPVSLAFTPDGAYAYVVNICGNGPLCESGSSISIIDTATTSVANTLPISGGAQSIAIAPVPYGCVAPPPPCIGDCSDDRIVTVDELVRGVHIALGNAAGTRCPAFDSNGDYRVTIDELIRAVNSALRGCGA